MSDEPRQRGQEPGPPNQGDGQDRIWERKGFDLTIEPPQPKKDPPPPPPPPPSGNGDG